MVYQIAFENINDTYSYGLYGEFKVVINTHNGFVNATKLVADGGKHLYHWLANQRTKTND